MPSAPSAGCEECEGCERCEPDPGTLNWCCGGGGSGSGGVVPGRGYIIGWMPGDDVPGRMPDEVPGRMPSCSGGCECRVDWTTFGCDARTGAAVPPGYAGRSPDSSGSVVLDASDGWEAGYAFA